MGFSSLGQDANQFTRIYLIYNYPISFKGLLGACSFMYSLKTNFKKNWFRIYTPKLFYLFLIVSNFLSCNFLGKTNFYYKKASIRSSNATDYLFQNFRGGFYAGAAPKTVVLKDIDLDNDLDVINVANTDNNIVIRKNIGGGK